MSIENSTVRTDRIKVYQLDSQNSQLTAEAYGGGYGSKVIETTYTESSSGTLFIEDNGVQPLDVYVGNLPADLYLDPQEGNRNILVWQDGNAQLLFGVASTLDGETMVKIAESVEVVQ